MTKAKSNKLVESSQPLPWPSRTLTLPKGVKGKLSNPREIKPGFFSVNITILAEIIGAKEFPAGKYDYIVTFNALRNGGKTVEMVGQAYCMYYLAAKSEIITLCGVANCSSTPDSGTILSGHLCKSKKTFYWDLNSP